MIPKIPRTVKLALVGCAIVAMWSCGSATPSAVTPTAPVGRYQIINGMPGIARYIMLLDTQTGQTWEVCGAGSGKDVASWCPMEMMTKP